MAKSTLPLTLTLRFKKETVNYKVYEPAPEDGVGSLYIPPAKLGPNPPSEFTVTLTPKAA